MGTPLVEFILVFGALVTSVIGALSLFGMIFGSLFL